jgi:hypothetical protein
MTAAAGMYVSKPPYNSWLDSLLDSVHSEMPTRDLLDNGGTMEGFQLWVNLPAVAKMSQPRYQDTAPENMPVLELQKGKVRQAKDVGLDVQTGSCLCLCRLQVWIRLIAGECEGHTAAIETLTPIKFLDIRYYDTVGNGSRWKVDPELKPFHCSTIRVDA